MATHVAEHGTLVPVVAEQVRAIMGRDKVSQAQVADWLDIKPSGVSARLRLDPATPFSLDDLEVLAERFGVPVAYFVTPGAAVPPREVHPVGATSRPAWAPRFLHSANLSSYDDAGWSSSVARWAHNPEKLSPEVPPIFPIIISPRWLESGLHDLEKLANGEAVAS